MRQTDIATIETELGKWDLEVPPATHVLQARFEKSNTQIGYQIPNPHRDLSILARPNGFHITSKDGRQARKDFVLHHSAIKSVQLLPSYTVDTKKSISMITVVAFAALAWVLGFIYHRENQTLSLIYILLGAILGSIFSLAEDSHSKRRNLMITYREGNADDYLLLSIGKREWVDAIDFFFKFCPDKFSQ
jgi:hypothetical protein